MSNITRQVYMGPRRQIYLSNNKKNLVKNDFWTTKSNKCSGKKNFRIKYFGKKCSKFFFSQICFSQIFFWKKIFSGNFFLILLFKNHFWPKFFYCCWDKFDVQGPLYTCLVLFITLHFWRSQSRSCTSKWQTRAWKKLLNLCRTMSKRGSMVIFACWADVNLFGLGFYENGRTGGGSQFPAIFNNRVLKLKLTSNIVNHKNFLCIYQNIFGPKFWMMSVFFVKMAKWWMILNLCIFL